MIFRSLRVSGLAGSNLAGLWNAHYLGTGKRQCYITAMAQAEVSARGDRALCAWREWSSALIPAPLLQELETAAGESHMTLPRFVAELLECHAAARRLTKVESLEHSPGARPPGSKTAETIHG